MKFAFLQRLYRLLAVNVIRPPIPDHYCTAAVLALRNRALEIFVIDRMILDLNGEMFFSFLPGKSFRQCPGFQNAFHLKPEIVMQPAGRMLLNYKSASAVYCLWQRFSAARFSGFSEIAFRLIFSQSHCA